MTLRFPFVLFLTAVLLAACGDAPDTESASPAPESTAAQPEAPAADESAGEQDASAIPQYSIEQFMDTERLGGASFSPDGARVAFSSNRSGVFNVYAQPVDGGEAVQLTDSTTDPKFVRAYFPNDARLIFSGDQGGNELDHVYLRNLDGSVVDLTPGETLKANFAGFSEDGSAFWISTNERDSSVFDVYEYDAETLERELILENTVDAFLGPISPDGSHAALTKVHLRSDTDILLWRRETGEITPLVTDEGEVANSPETFSADGTHLFYTTDRGSEFDYLVSRNLATGEESVVLQPEWDVTYASRSSGDNYLVVGINEDSRTALKLLAATDFSEVALPEMPDGNVTSVEFSDDDSQMAFYFSSSRRPSDLFVVSMEGEGNDARALTWSTAKSSGSSPTTASKSPASCTARTRPPETPRSQRWCASTAAPAARPVS